MSPYYLDVYYNIVQKRIISVVAAFFFSDPRKTSCDILVFSCILCFTSRFLAAAVNVNFAHLVKRTKVSTQNRLNKIMHPEFDQNGSF